MHFYQIVSQGRVEYQSLIFFGEKYIYLDTVNKKRTKIMDKQAKILIRNCFMLAFLLVGGLSMFYMFPIYMFLTTGKLYPLMPYRLPGTNFDSHWGYFINTVAQCIMSFYVAVPNVGNDCTFAMMLSSLWTGTEITKQSLNEIEVDLKMEKHLNDLKWKLKQILMEIQELER